MPILWLVSWKTTGKVFPPTPLNLSLLLLSLMLLVSLFATYSISVSLPKIGGLLLGLAAFFIAARESQKPWGLAVSLFFLAAAGVGIAVLGLLNTQWFTGKLTFLNPITEILPQSALALPGAESGFHPNEVAGVLLWVLPILVAVCLVGLFKYRQLKPALGRGLNMGTFLLLVLTTVFVGFVFILAQSRTAYLALAFTLVVMLLVWVTQRNRLILPIGLLVLALGTAAFFWFGNPEALWGQLELKGSGLEGAFSLSTLAIRMEIWDRALQAVRDFPLTGMGMNTFRVLVHELYPFFTIPTDTDIGHAHNEFLQTALDLGIPGLIALLSIYLVAFWMLFNLWKSADQESKDKLPPAARRALILGCGGGLFAHALFGLIDAVALGAKPGIVFWILLGVISGLFLESQQTEAIGESTQAHLS
jgi:O-antigen ligase